MAALHRRVSPAPARCRLGRAVGLSPRRAGGRMPRAGTAPEEAVPPRVEPWADSGRSKDAYHNQLRMPIQFDAIWQDVRYGCRVLRRNPGFSRGRVVNPRNRHCLRDHNLQLRAAEASAVQRTETVWFGYSNDCGRGHVMDFDPRLPGLAVGQHGLRTDGGAAARSGEDDRAHRRRAATSGPRHGPLLRCVRGEALSRADVRRRGGRAREGARRRAGPCALAGPVRADPRIVGATILLDNKPYVAMG